MYNFPTFPFSVLSIPFSVGIERLAFQTFLKGAIANRSGRQDRFPRELSILNIKKLPRIGSKHIFPTLVQSRIHLRSSIDDNFGDKSADIPPRIVQDLLTTVMTALFFIEKSRKISLEISASYCTRTTTLDPHSNHAHDPKNFFLFHKFSKEAFCRCGFERIR